MGILINESINNLISLSLFEKAFWIKFYLEYKIEELDLCQTLDIVMKDRINEDKLKLILKSLSKSKLSKTLKTVRVYEEDFKSPKVESIFK